MQIEKSPSLIPLITLGVTNSLDKGNLLQLMTLNKENIIFCTTFVKYSYAWFSFVVEEYHKAGPQQLVGNLKWKQKHVLQATISHMHFEMCDMMKTGEEFTTSYTCEN